MEIGDVVNEYDVIIDVGWMCCILKWEDIYFIFDSFVDFQLWIIDILE